MQQFQKTAGLVPAFFIPHRFDNPGRKSHWADTGLALARLWLIWKSAFNLLADYYELGHAKPDRWFDPVQAF